MRARGWERPTASLHLRPQPVACQWRRRGTSLCLIALLALVQYPIAHSRTLTAPTGCTEDGLDESWQQQQPESPEVVHKSFAAFVSQSAHHAQRSHSLHGNLLPSRWWASTNAPLLDLTVITTITTDREGQLLAQCESWGGPMSACAYLPLLAGAGDHATLLSQARESLDRLHKQVEKSNLCQLDLVLAYEVVADVHMGQWLPINSMRNYALMLARTSLVSMIDADLVISRSLSQWLGVPSQFESIKSACNNDTIFVLPAFETQPLENLEEAHALASKATAASKSELAVMQSKGEVEQFAKERFFLGHGATDYPRWFESNEAYVINYQARYEPWFIAARQNNAFYDARFRGYGFNKIIHVTTMYSHNMTFMVHPAGFLVHRQHEKSAAALMFRAGEQEKIQQVKLHGNKPWSGQKNNLFCHNKDIFRRLEREMFAGEYAPLVDDFVKACCKTLPWYRDMPPGGPCQMNAGEPGATAFSGRRPRAAQGSVFMTCPLCASALRLP